jgi:hypothetical protein
LSVTGVVCATGGTTCPSDERLKNDIESLRGALDTLRNVRAVTFSWRRQEFPEMELPVGRQMGFIAQEMLWVVPEVVIKGEDGYYSIDYGKLTPLLTEAIQELKAENDSLRTLFEKSESRSVELFAQVMNANANLYTGSVVLDGRGEVEVELPVSFEAMNSDFRYQLTCVGGFAPVYIAAKVHDSRFRIAGGTPGLEVSWQVTGVRHDPAELESPLVVGVDKSSSLDGATTASSLP